MKRKRINNSNGLLKEKRETKTKNVTESEEKGSDKSGCEGETEHKNQRMKRKKRIKY